MNSKDTRLLNRREFSGLCVALSSFVTSSGASALASYTSMVNWDGSENDYGVSPLMPNDGKWSHHTYFSNIRGRKIGFVLRVPQQYLDNPNQRFPVLYMCKGGHTDPGSPGENIIFETFGNQAWINGPMVDWVDPATGQDRPVIYVHPNGSGIAKWVDAKKGSGCLGDQQGMYPMAAMPEFIAHIDANWRTVNHQKARAIIGGSGGGVGCARAAFLYPELFCAAYIFFPACDDFTTTTVHCPNGEECPNLINTCAGDGAYWDNLTLQHLVVTRRDAILAAGTRFKMSVGVQDPLYTDGWVPNFFNQIIDEGLSNDGVDLMPGGHTDTLALTPEIGWPFSQFDQSVIAAAHPP